MTQTRTRRLSRYYFLFVLSLLVPLVGFFIYASQYDMRFFLYLTAAFSVNIIVLWFFYRRLKNKRSTVKLQKEEYFEKTNLLRSDLEKERQVIVAFRQKIASYSQLKGLLEKLSGSLSVEETGQTLCHEVARMFEHGDSTVILSLIDWHSGQMEPSAAVRHRRIFHLTNKKNDIFDRWVLKTLQALYVVDAKHDFRFDADKVDLDGSRPVRAILSVPLMVHDKMVGVLRMDNPMPGRFTEEDLRFFRAIADVAAVLLENAQLYDKVEDLAIRDGLTELYLRRYLMERLASELERRSHRPKDISLVMLDLDHFKRYNDQFGHTAGDIVLRSVASFLKQHFDVPDALLCRYGGEEFCILLPGVDKKEAGEMVRKFIHFVQNQVIMLRREKTHITVSAGLASFPKDADTVEALIHKADASLYEAKAQGRNRLCTA